MCRGVLVEVRCKCASPYCPHIQKIDLFKDVGHLLYIKDTMAYDWCRRVIKQHLIGQQGPPSCPELQYEFHEEDQYRPNMCEDCYNTGCAASQDPRGEEYLPSRQRSRLSRKEGDELLKQRRKEDVERMIQQAKQSHLAQEAEERAAARAELSRSKSSRAGSSKAGSSKAGSSKAESSKEEARGRLREKKRADVEDEGTETPRAQSVFRIPL